MPLNIWDELASSTPRYGLSEAEIETLHNEAYRGKYARLYREPETRRDFFDRELEGGRLEANTAPELMVVGFIGITMGRRAAELGLLVDSPHSSAFHFTPGEMEQVKAAEKLSYNTSLGVVEEAQRFMSLHYADQPGQLEQLIGYGIAMRAAGQLATGQEASA